MGPPHPPATHTVFPPPPAWRDHWAVCHGTSDVIPGDLEGGKHTRTGHQRTRVHTRTRGHNLWEPLDITEVWEYITRIVASDQSVHSMSYYRQVYSQDTDQDQDPESQDTGLQTSWIFGLKRFEPPQWVIVTKTNTYTSRLANPVLPGSGGTSPVWGWEDWSWELMETRGAERWKQS